MLRRSLALALLLVAGSSYAAKYTVRSLPETRQAKVTIDLDASEPSREFRMPAWAPGDYEIFNYGNRLSDVRFFRAGIEVASARTSDPNLWTVEGGADRVEYLVGESRGNFSPNLRVTPDETFVSGPGVMGWFAGHTQENQFLVIEHEQGFSIAVALSEVDFGGTQGSTLRRRVFEAPDYDTLIDSPFVVSRSLRTKGFTVGGKPHTVAVFNKSAAIDLDSFVAVCTKAVQGALDLFGELPYPKYVFLFDAGGGGGGLEHLNCTRIGIGAQATGGQAKGIIFHEYFHAFNVKRIRSAPLGPFDYTKPAVTGALWWLEGVTDYYASVLSARVGAMGRDDFLRTMSGVFAGLHRGSAFAKVSADEASRRVWESNNSNGFGGLSYYTKGSVVGMALDLAIRAGSGNERSLDDVMKALYAECEGPKGFAEGRIRELCVQFGGAALGPFYDACVMQAVRIPIEPVLQECGLVMEGGVITADPQADSKAAAIGRGWPFALKRG